MDSNLIISFGICSEVILVPFISMSIMLRRHNDATKNFSMDVVNITSTGNNHQKSIYLRDAHHISVVLVERFERY